MKETQREMFAVVDEAWEAVRIETCHEWVVAAANDWLQALWPRAAKMGVAPRGSASMKCPRIIVHRRLAKYELGCYYPSGHYFGPRIDVPPSDRMKEYVDGWGNIQTPSSELRRTILHEVVHAFEDRSGRLYARIVNNREHDRHFERRLCELERLYPIKDREW